MSIASDIAAILARADLSDAQKRDAIYALKAGKVGEQAVNLVGKTVSLGSGYSVTFTLPPSIEGGDLSLWFTATHDGQPIPFDPPLIIRNPPVIHQGAESPLAALREVVLSVLRRSG